MLEIVVDGGCRGNGTDSAKMYGSARISGKFVTWEFGLGTNNQAEYLALIEALKSLKDLFPFDCITIRMDSELVRNQVLGNWKIKDASLRPLVFEVRNLLAMHSSWRIEHISGSEMKRILGH